LTGWSKTIHHSGYNTLAVDCEPINFSGCGVPNSEKSALPLISTSLHAAEMARKTGLALGVKGAAQEL
jgi:hypothetical protein